MSFRPGWDDPDEYCMGCDCCPCECPDDPDDSGIFAPQKVGTSECPGTCDPTCDWCLASHDCPGQCGGGDACPYVALERGGR